MKNLILFSIAGKSDEYPNRGLHRILSNDEVNVIVYTDANF